MKTTPISIFLPSANGGGAERAMLVFATEVVNRGIPVELILSNRVGAWASRIPDGITVVNLGQSRMIRAIPKLVAHLRRNRPRALFSTITHANLAAALAAHWVKLPCPVIVRQSNTPISESKTTVARRVATRLIRHVYPLVDGIIAVSHGVQEELLALNPVLASRIRVIPTPVLTDEIKRQGQEEPEHPWFDESSVPVVMSAGRLELHKGMLDLIRAFALVRRRRACRLLILGEGSERPRLEAEIERLGLREDISMPGFNHNPFPSMRRSAAFVLASHYEGLPNVLVQALAFGTPVVSTDCKSGPAEILENGRYGSLVPVGAIQELANAIDGALESPKRIDAQDVVWRRFGAAEASLEYLRLAGLS